MKVAVFIPIYNSAEAIQSVILDLSSYSWSENIYFYFLDNCSSDETIEITIKSLKQSRLKQAQVLRNQTNIGLGGSQKVAFTFAHKNAFEAIAIFHGDYQPTAEDLSGSIKDFKLTKVDAVLGSRFLPKSKREKYSKIRFVANVALNLVYSLRFFRLVSDLGSGLNIYKTSALPDYKSLPNDLAFNCNLLILQLKKRNTILWRPIEWRQGLAASNLKSFDLGLKSLKSLIVNENEIDFSINLPTVVFEND
jgi:glycosyltransferase involved in cell wall biosynthesis